MDVIGYDYLINLFCLILCFLGKFKIIICFIILDITFRVSIVCKCVRYFIFIIVDFYGNFEINLILDEEFGEVR